MKRIIALLLVLAALFSALAAHAEENASIVRVTNLSLSYVSENSASSASFSDAVLILALGTSEGAPTLQIMFDNGAGQAVDAVMQIVDARLLFGMGGISATYAIDFDNLSFGGLNGADLAKGLSQALAMAGPHLDVVLYAGTRDEGNGWRSIEAPLSLPQMSQLLQAMLSLADGIQIAEDAGLSDLQALVNSLDGEAMLGFRYQPETGLFDLAAIQNGTGMRLSGTLEMTFEPMTFLDITTEDVEIYDLMNLTSEQRDELQGELGMLFPKFMDFADGAGMNGILP